MVKLLAAVIVVALFGGLLVPIILIGMAQIGWFEPIEFELRGRTWCFPERRAVRAYACADTWSLGPATQSFAMPAVLFLVVANIQFTDPEGITDTTALNSPHEIFFKAME